MGTPDPPQQGNAGEGDPAAKRHAPAALRNRDPIAGVLAEILPPTGGVLEVASGSGEHVIHFARLFPDLAWQPSDPDPICRASITAWSQEAELPNLLLPLDLDASRAVWTIDHADAVLCINMAHISPWNSTLGLLAGSQRILPPGAPLYFYGPFRESDAPFAPSNVAFDSSLRARDPDWGIRDLQDIRTAAEGCGLRLERRISMPANNLSVVFRRTR